MVIYFKHQLSDFKVENDASEAFIYHI